MSVELHVGDLPADVDFGSIVAIDTETMGLSPERDRLCVVQLSAGDGTAHIVQLKDRQYDAPNLKALLVDPEVIKVFHFGRFDLGMLQQYLGIMTTPIYCTKIASKLVRTYTDRHGLKDLCRELLSVDLSKAQQSSDWGADTLTRAQLDYAASDVLHLHKLRDRLNTMLEREGRTELAAHCFRFLETRVRLDLAGFAEEDIFHH